MAHIVQIQVLTTLEKRFGLVGWRRCARRITLTDAEFDDADPCWPDVEKARDRLIGAPSRPQSQKPSNRGPGDVIKAVLTRMGVKVTAGCGCGPMRRRMNKWGYSGCFLRLPRIVWWFRAKAKERGIVVDTALVARTLYAVWAEANNRPT